MKNDIKEFLEGRFKVLEKKIGYLESKLEGQEAVLESNFKDQEQQLKIQGEYIFLC